MRDRSRVTTRALTRYDASSPIALGCYGDQRVTSSVLRCRVPPTLCRERPTARDQVAHNVARSRGPTCGSLLAPRRAVISAATDSLRKTSVAIRNGQHVHAVAPTV